MFSRDKKIKRGEFPTDLRGGARYHSPNMSVVVFKNENTYNKYSFVVSGKIDKRATARNRLKRRGYYAIKKLAPKEKGALLIFFPKKNTNTLPYKEVEAEIKKLLVQASLL